VELLVCRLATEEVVIHGGRLLMGSREVVMTAVAALALRVVGASVAKLAVVTRPEAMDVAWQEVPMVGAEGGAMG